MSDDTSPRPLPGDAQRITTSLPAAATGRSARPGESTSGPIGCLTGEPLPDGLAELLELYQSGGAKKARVKAVPHCETDTANFAAQEADSSPSVGSGHSAQTTGAVTVSLNEVEDLDG